MKQTAVEFIAQELSKQIDNNLFMELTFNKLLEQAKAMEKEQIMDAFDKGLITENVYYGYDDKKSEQYYNQTFKSK